METLWVKNNGTTIWLDYYASSYPDSPWVLILHPFSSHRKYGRHFSELLLKEGISSIAVDIRGHGDSEGALNGAVLDDIQTVVAFAQMDLHLDQQPMAVVGSSMGGYYALQASTHLPDLACIAVIAPATEQNLLSVIFSPVTWDILEKYNDLSVRIQFPAYPNYLKSHSIWKVMPKIEKPVLFIHSKADEILPCRQTEEMFTHLNSRIQTVSRLELLERGSHFASINSMSVFRSVVDWMKSHLMSR